MYGKEPSRMAYMLVGCILDYLNTQSHSVVELIDIVIYQSHMLADYTKAMNKVVASARTTGFKSLINRNRAAVDNVYQVQNASHKVSLNPQ